jgi:hypothetical protein
MRRIALIVVACAVLAWPAIAAAEQADPTPAKVVQLVERINARLEAGGSPLRLTEAWFFTIGRGVDPYRRLRTGVRWYKNDVTYLLDQSDYAGTGLPSAEVDQAVDAAFQTWNGVRRSSLWTTRTADGGGNYDILDAIVLDGGGNCVDIVDTTSPNLIAYDPTTGNFEIDPEADIVFGGWIDPAYFSSCLGSANIIGVTWSFSSGDGNFDGYPDLVYVEQFYNSAFPWTTTDAVYLDFGGPIDIETIGVHENGHAIGLGHFGGPNALQPFKLQPNLRVFDPEAVMNPYYLGGEKRVLFPTDVAGVTTLYGRH